MRRLTLGLLVSAALCGSAAFATAPADATGCPNEATREQQLDGTRLPDCRAYEVVSPGWSKAGGIVELVYSPISPDGERVLIQSGSPFGDATQGFIETPYLAQRDGSGWHSTFMQKVPLPETLLSSGPRAFLTFTPSSEGGSTDLSHVYSDFNYWTEPGFTSGLWESDPSGHASVALARRPLFGELDPGTLMPFGVGASRDGSHLVVSSYLQSEEAPSVQYLYEKAGPLVRMVNVDDEGDPITGSSGAKIAGNGDPSLTAVSEDGSHIYFTVDEGPDPQLYLRLDGTATFAAADAASGGESPVRGLQFAGASADGEIAYFLSPTKLLSGMSGSGPYLYRWQPTAGSLEVVAGEEHPVSRLERGLGSIDNLGPQVLVDRDGRSFYYETPDDGGSIYRSDGTTSTLVVSGAGEVVLSEREGASSVYLPEELGRAYESPDGHHLVFRSKAVGLAGTGDTNTGYKIYRYAVGSTGLKLISTGPTAPSSPFNSEMETIPGTSYTGSKRIGVKSPQHFMSDDGQYVFFQTAAPLVAADENQATDVYEWHEGEGVRLISAGQGESPSQVAGSTPDGSSVLFFTTADLAPQDGDDMLDLYVARTDGGFYEAPRQACSGESCQPASPAVAPSPVPASATFSAPPAAIENPTKPRSRCPSGKKQRASKKKGSRAKGCPAPGAKHRCHSGKKRKKASKKKGSRRKACPGRAVRHKQAKQHGKRKHAKSKQGDNR